MKAKHIATMMVLVAVLPLLAVAGWQATVNTSSGTTPISIVSAPGSGSNRVVTANGGLKVHNTATSNLTFTLNILRAPTSNKLDEVTLGSNQTWIADYVIVLNSTTNSLEFVGNTDFGTSLEIFTHYRDEAQ